MLERQFFMAYPMGFDTPEMLEISKKHKVKKNERLCEHTF